MTDWRDELINAGITFSNIRLRPQYSDLETRTGREGGPKTETQLTSKIKLAIPIVSANMDTVTESAMAIAMARLGGIGIIHRNCSIEKQVEEVEKVKRAEEGLIREPYTLFPADSVHRARELMAEHQIDSVLIVDIGIGRKFLGLITKYEIANAESSEMVGKYMKPREQLIVIEVSNILLTEKKAKELAESIFKDQPLLGKLPFVDEHGELLGLMTKKDLFRYAFFPDATKDGKGRLCVGAAIGVDEKALRRAEKLLIAGADVLVLDVAHAHASKPMDMARAVKISFRDCELIMGNVATAEAVRDLMRLEIGAIKVGIGPGATCSTRIVSGAGVPQVSAILECAREAEKCDIPIIADGGIRYPGDVSIAIACGASSVMIGTLFAGTDESPGTIIRDNEKLFKLVRGMSSLDVNIDIRGDKFVSNLDIRDMIQPEGVSSSRVPYSGLLIRVLGPLVAGLRSGMTYVGASDISDMKRPHSRKFTKISSAAWEESKPHDIEII